MSNPNLKPKNDTLTVIVVVLAILATIYIVGSGLATVPCMYIKDYQLAEDGKSMEIETFVGSPLGSARSVHTNQQDGVLYLDFNAAYGGCNGKIGAKDTFIIPIDEETKLIALARYEGGYEKTLEKDPVTGEWVKVVVPSDSDISGSDVSGGDVSSTGVAEE